MNTRRQARPSLSNPFSGPKSRQGSSKLFGRLAVVVSVVSFLAVSSLYAFSGSTSGKIWIGKVAKGSTSEREVLLLTTKHGSLKIVLRPDLSSESVKYVHDMVAQDECSRCNFYRSEGGWLLQGVFASSNLKENKILGSCPPGAVPPEKCPEHDPNCGCHGPVMTNGMVAWAGGTGGPDFFINSHREPATLWGTEHTVWGEIQDGDSFAVIDKIYKIPPELVRAEKISFTAKIIHEEEGTVRGTVANKKESPPIQAQKQVKTMPENETLVLTTKYGLLKIVLRPDLSRESVQYIHEMDAHWHCDNCKFYRADKPGILQGIISSEKVEKNTDLGKCPTGEKAPQNCPDYDKNCACHGPVMTRGMVAWAAGAAGPDLFINTYPDPVELWETQHTVWGEIQDEESFAVTAKIYELPSDKEEMGKLHETIDFTMKIVKR